jgi:hypothetical protein
MDALDRGPDSTLLLTGASGEPLRVLREYFTECPEDVSQLMTSAIELGLQLVVRNRQDHGRLEYVVTLLSDEIELPAKGESWLPPLKDTALLERLRVAEADMAAAVATPQWKTFASRAYWAWIPDEEHADSASAEIVVEHWDVPVDPVDDTLAFNADDDQDEETRGPLTARNRFMLYMSLRNISADLDGLTGDWGTSDSQVREDLPSLVRSQPLEWWQQMEESAERLLEAARTGATSDLVPRTPAEEALIAISTWPQYIDWATDTVNDFGLEGHFSRLPCDTAWDGEYGEILPHLTGDADIELVWRDDLDGIGSPDDPVNQSLGMGDYRPESWHRLFERAVRQASHPRMADPEDPAQ